MTFSFDTSLVQKYHSNTQIARVLTEDWLGRNMYCPICGVPVLKHFEANRPVADFYCNECHAEYELKSKERTTIGIGDKIVDGEYNTMIGRITALNNPNFFFLTYANNVVRNLLLIPNYFFTPNIIEKRKPLSDKARRAGWTGCNINLTTIPECGKIYVVKDSVELDHEIVHNQYLQAAELRTTSLTSRGWLMDVLLCVEKLDDNFTLEDMYHFVDVLQQKHLDNNNVEAKIRQQLQVLRDKGILKFTNRGHYSKIKHSY